ncbi:hypothetical protein L7F22_051049 [Adiantum nelumboides]|nr:hypothetical protein [Adiantum nelumboides]
MQDCKVPYTTSLYNDDKACAEMVYCMAKYLMDFALKKVSSSRWFGVMIDESTDISTHGHMVIYLSYLEDECIPKMSFYGIVRVCDGTAKSLFNAVIDELKRCKLDLSKLIAFGSDGCSTMTGKENGVSSLLKKNVNPFLTSIHCVAHRSALAVSSVAKSMDACKKLDKLVNSLATFYNGSSKRLKELQEMQEDLACPILRLQHTYDIRWLSRYNALNALCLSFDAILKLSRKDNLPLFNEISNFQFIYSLFFMTDILKGLATLSKTFQRDHVDVTSVKSLVDNQISRIKEYYIEDPKLDCNALTHGVGGFEILQEYGSPKGHLFTLREALRGNMFYDEKIKRDICGEDLRNALEFQFSFASAIITNLECRFEDNTILNNMKIFVPAQFPLLERALKVFGNVEVENLTKFDGKKQRIGILDFDPIIDGDDLKNEFKTFKNQAPKDFVRYSLTKCVSNSEFVFEGNLPLSSFESVFTIENLNKAEEMAAKEELVDLVLEEKESANLDVALFRAQIVIDEPIEDVVKDFEDIEGELKEKFLALYLETTNQKLLEALYAFDICLKRVVEEKFALKDEDFEAKLVELVIHKFGRDVVEPNKINFDMDAKINLDHQGQIEANELQKLNASTVNLCNAIYHFNFLLLV